MNTLRWEEFGAAMATELPKGIFLLSSAGGKDNIMTIGWGSVGIFWGMPVFTAAVRFSRHSYGLIRESGVFSICVPKPGELIAQRASFGKVSGRDQDKLADQAITVERGRAAGVPVLAGCATAECRVIMDLDMSPGITPDALLDRWYPTRDLHAMIFGEILACYE